MAHTSRGIWYPSTSDTVRPASRDFKDLALTTTAAIDEVNHQLSSDIEAGRLGRLIPQTDNLDDYRTADHAGRWIVTDGTRIPQGAVPFGNAPFILDVTYVNQAAWQQAWRGGFDFAEPVERKWLPNAATWTEWEPIGGTSGNGGQTGQWSATDPVYFWGDSAVSGGGGDGPWDTGENLPGQLDSIFANDVINRGEGGRTSNQTLVRAGAMTITATPVGGQIPTSGSVDLDLHAQVIGGWEPNTYTGYYAGVYGTLRQLSTGFTFTRSAAGSAITVDTPQPFVSTDTIDGSGTHIFLTGGNDWLDAEPYAPEVDKVSHVIANYLRAIHAVPGPNRHVLIGGVKTRRDTEIGDANHRFVQTVNRELARLVPQHFVSRQDWLVNNALDALGLSPTAEDLRYIEAGIIPKRAFSDVTHIRREIMPHEAAGLWAPALQQRGWASSTTTLQADALPSLYEKEARTAIHVDHSVGERVFVGDIIIYGDTGWRDMSTLIQNGWSANSLQLRRVGPVVYVRFSDLSASGATNPNFLQLPHGFRTFRTNIPSGSVVFGANATAVMYGPTGYNQGTNYFQEFNFSTTDPWPPSLPGTPV